MTQKFTAIYTRVSTKGQAEFGTSLDYQEEACRKKAFELGIPESHIKLYREAGESGEDIIRPEMNKLREDVKNSLIERIIILHPDRLSRDMIDRLIVCSEFDKYEVNLVFVDTEYKNSEEGKLFFNIQSSISQYELALIKKRTSRGVIQAVKDGKVMPMRVPPYGYDLVESQLVINKEEAAFVKKIYQWYVYDKLTMRQIGERLYSLGAIPKRSESKNWNASSIQRVLKSEVYIGKYYYNKKKTKKIKGEKTESGNPKRTYETRDKEEWIEVEVPRIIDDVTFSLADEQRTKNTKKSGNVKREYLLRQLIRCANCGVKYTSLTSHSYTKSKKTGEVTSSHHYRYYRCVNCVGRKYGEGAEKCPSKPIKADMIEKIVWDEFVYKIVSNPKEAMKRIKNDHTKPSKDIEETYNLLKFKLVKFEEEKKRIAVLYRKGLIDEDEMDADIEKINNEIKLMKSELKSYEEIVVDFGKQQMSLEMLEKTFEKYVDIIKNPNEISFDVKRKIIEHLFDEIIIKHDGESLKVYGVGIINTILNGEAVYELCSEQEGVINSTNKLKFTFEALISLVKGESHNKMDYIIRETNFKIA